MPSPLRRHLSLRAHLRIIHHVPGRIRLRFSQPRKGSGVDTNGLTDFLAEVRAVPGILSVRVSPATLSAVVEYDAKVLRPDFWPLLLSGPEDEALAALGALTGRRDVEEE